jgi:hypothetical protein
VFDGAERRGYHRAMSRLTRRAFARALAFGASSLALPLSATAKARGVEPLPPLPIVPHVSFVPPSRAGEPKRPVVDASFLDEQIARAVEIFGPFGVAFAFRPVVDLAAERRALETREDRDALGGELEARVINVFFVESLRDVDDPSRYRMGVTWRQRTALLHKYVVVASSALPTTMAHELGHFLGLDHSSVKNNLMSYDRDGKTVFLDARQGAVVRRNAEGLCRTKALDAEAGG